MSDFSRRGVMRPLVGMAVLFLAGLVPAIVRAQGVVPSTSSAPGALVRDPAPPGVVIPDDVVDSDEPATVVSSIPGPPGYGPPTPPARVVMGPLDVIGESIFGEASVDEWQPLSLS